MTQHGFILIHRKMLEWEWFSDAKMVQVALYCLLRANHKDTKYKGVILKRGEFMTSLPTMESELNMTTQTLRTCLSKLKKSNFLTDKLTNKYRVVSVCNYSEYQDNEISNNRQTNRQLTDKQQATNRQLTADNNDNNDNNENNIIGGEKICLNDFYKIECKDDFKQKCIQVAIGRKFNTEQSGVIFNQFENYWLSPERKKSENKKDWLKTFQNWLNKHKPKKNDFAENKKIAENILNQAMVHFGGLRLIDHSSEKLHDTGCFLNLLNNGYTKNDILDVLERIIENPPANLIYSWGILHQYKTGA